jgi:hypothetical protein
MGDTKPAAPHDLLYSALRGDMEGKHAEVSRGHCTSGRPGGKPERGNEKGSFMSFGEAKSLTGGADFRRVMEDCPLDLN